MGGQTRSERPRRRTGWLVAGIAALVALMVVGLRGDLKWHVIPKRWDTVEEPYIYRSGRLSRYLVRDMLEKHQIQVVIDMAPTRDDDPDYQAELRATEELGIKYHHYTLASDGTGDIEEYLQALVTLVEAHRARQRVWVHCYSGLHRSGALVVLWRMFFQGRSSDAAYEEYASYLRERSDGQILIDYFDEHLRSLVDGLLESGTLEVDPGPSVVFGPTVQ